MIDRHHILHSRKAWSSRDEALYLRERPELVPRLDRDAHEELHRVAPEVPLLGHHALAAVHRLYEPGDDTMGSLDNLMGAIEKSAHHRKAHRVERLVAEAALEALDIQRAILRGNIVDLRVIRLKEVI